MPVRVERVMHKTMIQGSGLLIFAFSFIPLTSLSGHIR